MRIYSFSKLLSLPLILAAGYFLIRMFSGDHRGEPPYVLIPITLLVVLYNFYGNIDFWWLKKYPIPLDDKILQWLQNYLPYYNDLDEERKAEFDRRLVLYVDVRQFKVIKNKDTDEVPFDIKNILASQAVRLLLGQKDFLLKDMDRIYLYKHPFPSPAHQFLHTYEIDVIDGVIILSLEQALPGITNPRVHYNITLHAFAESFVNLYSQYTYPAVEKYGWEGLEKLDFIDKNVIISTCGYPDLDLLPVHIVAFFEFPNDYKKQFPEAFNSFDEIFNHPFKL